MRQRELQAVIIENDNEETCEWIDKDLVEKYGIEILEKKVIDQASLITIENHLSTPWTEI